MPSKGIKTKDRILTGASEIFNHKGINATSINDLLTATQTTRGNLYFHFADKQQLALAVLQRESDHFMDFLDQSLDKKTAGEALNNFFHQAFAKHQSTKFIGGCLFGNTALEASDTNPAFAEIVTGVFSNWTKKLEKKIREAQLCHEVRTDLAAANLATMIVATIEGGIMQSRLTKSDIPLKDCLETLQTMLKPTPNQGVQLT